ncbi:hypothetical protein HPB50_013891 [Hyalomma asiaticum]|uniref:Uncharacterized protein n=1 Tax=Hyalomma asiaticum TaxID=266040 RepID=A0ACB7RS47_HYAAI|nr:hypothetical protein HPB50_013891 [Hyalomma asiaticum]
MRRDGGGAAWTTRRSPSPKRSSSTIIIEEWTPRPAPSRSPYRDPSHTRLQPQAPHTPRDILQNTSVDNDGAIQHDTCG